MLNNRAATGVQGRGPGLNRGGFSNISGVTGGGNFSAAPGRAGGLNPSNSNLSGLGGSYVEKEEVTLMREFKDLDRDGNGKIDKDEMNVFLE